MEQKQLIKWRHYKMTIEALNEAIKRLLIKRQNTPQTDTAEIDRIGQKLTKLYDLKFLYYAQQKKYQTMGGDF